MHRASLTLLLTVASCQDYKLHPDEPEPADSGAQASWEAPGEPGGQLPPTGQVPVDTSPPVCDLEPRPVQAFEGEQTCSLLPSTNWSLALEQEITAYDFDGYGFGHAVVAPGQEGRPLVFLPLAIEDEGTGYEFLGIDVTTGSADIRIPSIVYGWPAPVFRGSAPGSGLFGSLAYAAGPRTILIDIDSGVGIRPDQEDASPGALARDVWHDGTPELVTGSFTYTTDATAVTTHQDLSFTVAPAMVDSDGDGRDELLNASGWWDAQDGSGSPWSGISQDPLSCCYFMGGVVTWGGDTVLVGHNGESHHVATSDGRVLWYYPEPNDDFSRETSAFPSVGDIDGDGEPELCAELYGTTTIAWNLDGTILWERVTSETPYLTNGNAMADLNADGVYELLIWGSLGLWILNGADGAVLAQWNDGLTLSWLDTPIIADVDDDGSAEIVLVGRREGDDWTYHPRIFVLGPAEGRWARTRPVWHQSSYDVTSVRDDGRVPVFPRPNFETYNSWRAQPAHDGDHPDLEVEVLETCRDDEQGVVSVHGVVHNRGSKDAPAGAVLRLLSWSEDSGTGLQDVATNTITAPIPSMTSSAGVVFEVSVEEWATRQVIQVDGAHDDECDLVNDRVDVWE